ncbi:protein sevenless [Drosophila ficusphila]|uniref:protein sevenless n=1 Tax=Drosophila ficusphila TaxID=30025 RepID=UPI0007E790CF|nr:protein sevenless [Drosophila ficusphila]XP_017045802.1 protein sevenless [Drosophila ficusphila]XP_017045803.1 protein sevenless [Drosophila ficusphila]XP_017045804.1 protein sevenless [Drosophila ficusphila]XP_043063359.1 protein sevenless [Drosophila ficusphila]
MTMFWHQNVDQQPEEQSKQQRSSTPTRRLNISFNVKIAVNVNTKMSTTHINQQASNSATSPSSSSSFPSSSSSSGSGSPGKIVVHQQSGSFDLRQQLARLGRQLTSGQDGHGGISTLLIVNLLLLILLSICCDVCRSANYSVPQSPEPAIKDQLGLLRPKLDSDVVEKVAIWHKHAAASPPSVVEGVAISSGPRMAELPPPPANPPEEHRGIDERVVLERVTRDCVQRCIVEEDLFLDEFGIQCEKADNSEKCYKTRCTKGCAQWYRALKELEPCQEACLSLQFYPFDLPCIGACEMAQRDYWHLQRMAISGLVERTQPQLERAPRADGQTTPLTIRWAMHFPEHYLASRPFNIQYQFVDHHGGDQDLEQEQEQEREQESDPDQESSGSAWFNLADYDCNEYYVCEILETLVPYTQYRFRFELPFGENSDEVLYSPATPAYQTPPEGAPISAPVIEHLLGLDDSHLAVHWHPGRFTNGPVEGYRLRLSSAKGNRSTEQLVPAGRGSFIFAQLEPGTNFTLELTMINKQGEGPAAKGFVATLASRNEKPVKDLTEGVLLAGRRAVMWQSLEPAGESSMIYQSQEELADVAWSQQEQRLWLLNVHGELRSLKFESGQMVSPAEKVSLELGNLTIRGWTPRRLSFDWLRHRLYFAMESLDGALQRFQIISTDLEGGSAEEAGEPLDLPVEQLEVDALNGWLFWRNEESLWRQDLHGRLRYRLVKIRQPGWFTVRPQNFLIRLMLPQEDRFLELSYDGGFRQPLPLPQNPSGSSAWRTFALLGRHLLLPSASQLILVEPNSGGQGASASWPLRHLPDCWALILLVADGQPLTSAAGRPQELRALLGSQAAEISWREPERNPYQSADAARNWSYELEVLDVASQSAFSIRNIRGPFFGLQRLQPDNPYQLRVRAIHADGSPGDWTNPLAARTWPLGPHRLRWSSGRGDLLLTDELGGLLLQEKEVKQLEALPGPLAMVNGSVGYYVGGRGMLHCIQLGHGGGSCPWTEPISHVGAVAYDWRGARIYWTDLARSCVVRMDPWSGRRELLPVFEARSLALDPRQGHLYYSTGSQLKRHGPSPEEQVTLYRVDGLEGSITSFALDTQQEQLYWLVVGAAELRLYRSSFSEGGEAPQLLHKANKGLPVVPHSLQLLRPLGALLWLERSGSRARLLRLAAPQDVMELPAPKEVAPASALQLLDPQPVPPPDPDVAPLAVAPDSVRLDDGHWDDFHVRWQPSTAGGNQSVSYRLLLEFGQRLQTLELSTPFARLTQLPQAQLRLRISITPRTAWRTGATTRVQLTTPAAAPSQPRRLRVFVERMASALGGLNVSALLRWDAPEQEQALEYHISCWLGSELQSELRRNQSALEARVERLQPDRTYRFQVEARVAATGAPAGAASHALHVAPEVQAVPRLLYANAEFIGELDLDTRSRRRLVHTASPVEHLAAIESERRLLWVNEHVELLTHVPGTAPAKLARMRAEVLALAVDWIQRMVYWAELDAAVPPAATSAVIHRLDLCRFEGKILQGERVWSTARGRLLRDLVALPQAGALVWLEFEQGAPRNGSLRGRNLTDGAALEFTTLQPLVRLHAGSLEPGAETLNLVDQQGKLCVYDVARQLCTTSALRTQLGSLGEDSLAQDSGYLYTQHNWSIRAFGRRRQQLEYTVELEPEEVRLLLAHNYQAYPPRSCLLLPPAADESQLPTVDCEERSCQLQLPLVQASEDCALPVPGGRYQLNLTLAQEQDELPLAQWVLSAGESLNMTDLLPFTKYRLKSSLSSYYQRKLGLPVLIPPPLEFRTAPATPSAPRNFSVRVLSPRELEVSWLPPEQLRSEGVYYTLHWQRESDGEQEEGVQREQQPQERRIEAAGSHRLTGVKPGSGYLLWVRAHATPTKSNSSGRVHVRSFAELPELQLLELGPYSLSLTWAGTPDPLGSLQLECRSPGEQLRRNVAGNHTRMVLEPLQPRTRYQCRLLLGYAATPGAPLYHGAAEVYETLGDAPGQPGRPQLEHIAEEVFRVTWTPARGNGAPIALYNLEALQARSNIRRRRRRRRRASGSLMELPWAEEPAVVEDQWLDFCNTTELSCIVRSLHSSRLLLFRVRARSLEHGWGPYSEESERVAEPFVSPEKRGSLVLAIIAPAAIVSSCVLALVLVRKVQKRRLRAKKLLQQSRPSIWSNLSTLQTQQQLMAARNRAFSTTLSDADIALLPQINWSQLKLLRFLGSGAFGEVYEGQLQTEDSGEPQRVAIKSLRKGASEFAELLQEAQLMSNFKHENIVCLVGICFDTESISLIMEHMEAGDLLSYLRNARNTSTQEQQPAAGLSLSELLAMCIDVANGCSYLEDMHFVHRDLACRNCLVTESSGGADRRRTVKIGDFGLARDIYKSDYYRKEGEGLLPVRWMSPESLVDGLFTTQSDVWAFGVLCWEILTLGQQPYAARNNFEVLTHVKEGGRLQQPPMCPEKLYSLLLLCWRTDPWERPSFRRCYNNLHAISTDLRRSQMASSPVDSGGISKPEFKVRFDGQLKEEKEKEKEKDKEKGLLESENLSLREVSGGGESPSLKEKQLYANEGVSRL